MNDTEYHNELILAEDKALGELHNHLTEDQANMAYTINSNGTFDDFLALYRKGVIIDEREAFALKIEWDRCLRAVQKAKKGIVTVPQKKICPSVGIMKFDDAVDEMRHIAETGGINHPLDIGLGYAMNLHFVMEAGRLHILTGMPSHGKSELMDQILINTMRNGLKWAVFSAENQPVGYHLSKLIEKLTGKAYNDISPELMSKALDAIRHGVYFIRLSEDDNSIEYIMDRINWLNDKHGTKGTVIDPYNEIQHRREHGESETEYISRFLSLIRNTARNRGYYSWLVAHPAKMQKDAKGNYPVPKLYDISGSANWSNKADVGISVWRDQLKNDPINYVHILKLRNRKAGRLGSVALRWIRETGELKQEDAK